jgi:hypothetical protein
MMAQDELDSFVDSLIERKNLKGLTPEGREDVANELKELLVEQINRAIIDALPDDKLDELDELTSKDGYTAEDMQKFIADSGVNVAKITTETLLYFESFYLGSGESLNE